MKKLGGAFALILAAASLAIGAELVKNTLQNLQSAYNGESNAGAKYLEFAKQADREGYGQAASLFRAAAASEQIHRTCEAAVMKEMGAVPHASINLPPVNSTKQNLAESAAKKGEVYEAYTMYPKFVRQARNDENNRAAQCFAYAQAAEAEHFNLFIAAAADLDQMKGGPATYYVCSEGGYTMAELNAAKCPGANYQEVK